MNMPTDGIPNAGTSGQPSTNMFASNGGPFMGVSIAAYDGDISAYDNQAAQDPKTSSGEGYVMGFAIPKADQ